MTVPEAMDAGLDPVLLDVLACPADHHAPLTLESAGPGLRAQGDTSFTLTCTECGRVFPIRDGIPVLLLDEALTPDGDPWPDRDGDSSGPARP